MKAIPVPITTLAWVAIMLLALSACGSGAREIRGELPLIRVEGLIVDGEQVTLTVGLRNVNDRTLDLRRLKVRMKVEDRLLLEADAQPQIDISARGRDVVTLRGRGQTAGLELLAQRFDQPAANDLPTASLNAQWSMELTLVDDRDRESGTRASGFLHPVPGRPGHFR
ncbi:hypothetical protein [Wenzhouxiangella limi]|uniref:Late embryogenesis abundant protein LEA-2 subgroup domain-containing protein n=1 Tax=Wenzhouxiangella limi TaxID=2707351 RepID=A0A845UXC5_9GAMM|nr:hypothetical protein [Wenzhouxiangella limi]NDY96513.1 hypothetical protein [Wenzhouxiangella limi]